MWRGLWRALFVLGLAPILLGGLAAAGAPPGAGGRLPAESERGGRPDQRAPVQGTPTATAAPTATPPPACGLFWRVVPSPNPGSYTISWAVAAVAANDVWMAGFYLNGAAGATLIEHWDGSSWTVVPSPNPGSGNNFLWGVARGAANDVWAVGDYANGSTYQTLVEHWTGSSWTVVPSPNQGAGSNDLAGVAVVAANDIWAVGNAVNGSTAQTLTEHWNGSSWAIVPSPNQGAGANHLYAVEAQAANDVWAVGDSGTQTLSEHWNGSSWTVVPSPNVGSGTNVLHSVAALAANDLWAAGSYINGGAMQSLVEHWTGSAWSVIPSANGGPGDTDLQGLAAVAAGDIWAVGYTGATAPQWVPYSEHWNGSQWSSVPIPNGPSPHNSTLWGVAAVAANDIWTVGDDSMTEIEHYSDPCGGGTPTPTATRTAGPPSATPAPRTATPAATNTQGAPSATPVAATGTALPPTPSPGPPTLTPLPTGTPLPTDTPGGPSATPASSATPTGAPPTAPPGPSPTPCSTPFSDVHPADYFYPAVQYLYCHGVISGYADGTFRPYADTTRAQMVKIIVLGFNKPISTPPGGASTFEDVPPSQPFFAYVETAAADTIVNGYPCGSRPAGPCVPPRNRPYFLPAAAVTRGQLSKIDVLAAGWALQNPLTATFEDVPPGSAFYVFVQTAAGHGVVSGYTCGAPPAGPCVPPGRRPYFVPATSATRGQIAKIVYTSIRGGSKEGDDDPTD